MIQQSVDDLQPQNRPPILQQQPAALAALPPFDFPAIMRRSGGNTASALLCEAVQGNVCVLLFSNINGIFCIFVNF
jgi:hypothetical protein